MTEPGRGGGSTVRLTISIKEKDEQQLNRLKHRLEVETGQRLNTSEVFRRAIACLCEVKGVL